MKGTRLNWQRWSYYARNGIGCQSGGDRRRFGPDTGCRGPDRAAGKPAIGILLRWVSAWGCDQGQRVHRHLDRHCGHGRRDRKGQGRRGGRRRHADGALRRRRPDRVRREVWPLSSLPVGNVPLYQAFCEATARYGDPNKLDEEMLFELIERQCADGISFMAIHCGINLYTIERLEKQGYRYGGLVSKGGSFMVAWMRPTTGKTRSTRSSTGRRNPEKVRCGPVAGKRHQGGLDPRLVRPGQMQELLINCELAERPRDGLPDDGGGPGHVPLDEIEANIILQKRMSGHAPYYMLGPLPTDVGAGYDHVVAAIGAAQSARYGADLICYITPAEHLALPNESDVRGSKGCPIGRSHRRHGQVPR